MTYILCLVFGLALVFSCLWLISVISYAKAARQDAAEEFHAMKVLIINSCFIAFFWGLTLFTALKTVWEFFRCLVVR